MLPNHVPPLSATSSGSTWWQPSTHNSRATSLDGVPAGFGGRSLPPLDLPRHYDLGGVHNQPTWNQLQASSLPESTASMMGAGMQQDMLLGIDQAALLQAMYQCSLQPRPPGQ